MDDQIESHKKEWAQAQDRIAAQRQAAAQNPGISQGALAGQTPYQPPTPPVKTRAEYIREHRDALAFRRKQLDLVTRKFNLAISIQEQLIEKMESDAPFSEVYSLQAQLIDTENKPLE